MDFLIDIITIIRGTLDLPSRPIFSLGSNTHPVGVRLISTGGKPLYQTRFSPLAAPLSSMDFFFSLLSIASAALFGLFTLIFHISTQSLGGVTRSRFYQSLVARFIARKFPHRPIAGLSIYLLQEATSSNTCSASQRAYKLDYVMSSR